MGDIVCMSHVNMSISMQCPRRCRLWWSERPFVAMSPTSKPSSTSATAASGSFNSSKWNIMHSCLGPGPLSLCGTHGSPGSKLVWVGQFEEHQVCCAYHSGRCCTQHHCLCGPAGYIVLAQEIIHRSGGCWEVVKSLTQSLRIHEILPETSGTFRS